MVSRIPRGVSVSIPPPTAHKNRGDRDNRKFYHPGDSGGQKLEFTISVLFLDQA